MDDLSWIMQQKTVDFCSTRELYSGGPRALLTLDILHVNDTESYSPVICNSIFSCFVK